MAKFTLTDDRTEVFNLKMHLSGRKRLHLLDAGADKNALQVVSTNPGVVTVASPILNDGRKGIWTIDLLAVTKGLAEIQAKTKGELVIPQPGGWQDAGAGRPTDLHLVTIAVTVADRLELPPATSEEGLLARLLLSENRSPGEFGYDVVTSKSSMQWMRVVLANRLKNKPKRFSAPGAKTITDVVKAPGQFKGFQNYPTLDSTQNGRIVLIQKIANDDNDPRQEAYARYLLDALEVAQSKTLIQDPCPTGLYGWRTVGHEDTVDLGTLVRFSKSLSGNQFFTLSGD